MELAQYLGAVAEQLVNELRPILAIRGVTENSDLLGKYTEATVRRLVHQIVHPMRVCTGAVLDHPIPVPLRQIDLIIWAPFPAPALFDVEGFGLVPKSSAFGVIEVKRTNYSGVEDALDSFFGDVDAKRIVAEPGGSIADYRASPGIGVVSLLEAKPSSRLQAHINSRRVVAIFERTGRTTKLRARDVLVLVNFLHYVTWRYRVQSSGPTFPQLNTELSDRRPNKRLQPTAARKKPMRARRRRG